MLNMNLFIIGPSQTGKSTLAQGIALDTGMKHITASSWVRSKFKPEESPTREDLTQKSTDLLREQSTMATDTLRALHDLDSGGYIIEGIRNPFDFARLYRPERDVVLFLSREDALPTGDRFDPGVPVIVQMRAWCGSLGIAQRSYAFLSLQSFKGPDLRTPSVQSTEPGDIVRVGNMDQAIRWASAWMLWRDTSHVHCDPTVSAVGKVHVDIPPFQALVRNALLYDNPKLNDSWSFCTVIGVSSYPGHAPTFTILTDAGGVFSYVPAHHLRLGATLTGPELDLSQLVYHNCPTAEVAVVTHSYLKQLSARCFERQTGQWFQARYVCTLDWYTDNKLLHLLLLDNGQIALQPNHKVLFGFSVCDLPEYKKMRGTWLVEMPEDTDV